jgi:hypothetical protein
MTTDSEAIEVIAAVRGGRGKGVRHGSGELIILFQEAMLCSVNSMSVNQLC